MLFSQASGHKVVSTSTAETVGRIDEFVIDPRARSVVALTVKKTDSGDTLRWPDLAAFGADAVTVADAAAITNADPDVAALSGKDHRALGKRVLTTLGDEIGKLDDVDFDPATGAVTALMVAGAPIVGDRLVGIGSYAVVVQA